MPASYCFDGARGVLFVTLHGTVTDDDLLEFAKKATHDPSIEPHHHELIDCREAEAPTTTTDSLRRVAAIFADWDQPSEGVRVAIVAPRDVAYGIARMYQAFRTGSAVDIQVFREMDQAQGWLGLEPA